MAAIALASCGSGTSVLQSRAATPADLRPTHLQSMPLIETVPDQRFSEVLSVVGEQPLVNPGTIVARGTNSLVSAHILPDADAPVMSTFSHPTEQGGPLVFAAVGEPTGGWIEVRLPIRPNGTTGWVRVTDVELSRNPYRVDLDVSGHELTISRDGIEVLSTTVAIGTGDTPTPIGDFYLIELLRPSDPNGVYGPFAFGLSGFSETLRSFNGGNGVIGIHGTNRPDLLGTDVSHGCIRVDNDVITDIAGFLPLGTPVSIRR